VDSLPEQVLSHIRRHELLKAGDRVGVAVSGGIDSVALLRVLLELRGELGTVLSVVHFNHRLRGAESDADQEFVARLAHAYDLEFRADGDDVAGHAAEERVSVETAARELRYGFFRYLLGGEGNPSGAEALADKGADDRSAESAAPPKGGPQGLKPAPVDTLNGTAEAVPFHEPASLRSASQRSHRVSHACLDLIVTGHTLDDQAETVLMRMIRGAGLRGLGGIHPRILVEDDDSEVSGEIVRPLLAVRHCELEQYLVEIGQTWREDSTNTDERFTRNRVRKLVVPLLEQEFNPAVADGLAELAEIARGEEDYWENEVAGWMGTTVQWSEPEWARDVAGSNELVQIGGLERVGSAAGSGEVPISDSAAIPTLRQAQGRPSRAKDAREMGHPVREAAGDDLRARIEKAPWLVMNAGVSRMWFLGEPVAVQRRLVKAIGDNAGIPLEFKHVEGILRVAAEDAAFGKAVSLPLGWKFVVEAEELRFVTPDLREPVSTRDLDRDYEYELPVPGLVEVNEAGSSVEARTIPAGAEAAYNPDQLLDAASLPGSLRVRNWRPGDRFWPAHTKSPKKIKELLQERHVAQPERRLWPVVVSGNQGEIVWMRGFSVPAKLRAQPGRAAVLILETLLGLKPAR
jgi:tRNA(Ile)-lysidine synthetase-like protein